METRKLKLALSAGAIALSMALAGCGGGGSSSGGLTPEQQAAQMAAEKRMDAITDAIKEAETAVAAIINSDDVPTMAQIGDANGAIEAANNAISASESAGDTVAASYRTRVMELEGVADLAQIAYDADDNYQTAKEESERLEKAEQERKEAEMEAEETANREAMAKSGKALQEAINDGMDGTAMLNSGMLDVDTDGNGSNTAVMLKAGDAKSALGMWNGMDYSHTMGKDDDKVTTTAMVYTNQGTPTSKAFVGTDAGQYTLTALPKTSGGSDHTAITVDGSTNAFTKAVADAFEHSGDRDHKADDREDAVYVTGEYDGAPGTFRCVGDDCSSTNDGEGSPSALGGTWHFIPDEGAMVSIPDADYLYFGWWLQKDSDDMPKMAGAFTGEARASGSRTNGGLAKVPNALTGSATFMGKAAGKFAINNPMGGSNAGHFTADATLMAKFGDPAGTPAVADAGISGTINNFMANDESVMWSVKLERLGWGSDNTFTTAENTMSTTWSIDGNAAGKSGSWKGQLYDNDTKDGSNLPTDVTGVFDSKFGSTHSMVGAFGARAQ